MITQETLFEATRQVLAQINDGEFPETYEYLDGVLDEGDPASVPPAAIAGVLVKCDRPKRFPAFLVDYITGLFECGIEAGDPAAMLALGGEYYDGGRGFEQSFAKAVRLYQMAAERGDRNAYACLGYCYYYGRDMAPDHEKAFRCFSAAALAGDLEAMYKLGDMYLRGHWVDRDEREAFIIYNRCLQMMTDDDRGHIAGPLHLRLADMCLDGLGTDPDPKTALFHSNLAEVMLYRMVRDGNYMYKKSLRLAIEGQARARERLARNIAKDEWIDEPI